MKYESLSPGFEALTKIRYKDPGSMSTLSFVDDKIKVMFHKNVKAVASGQSAVFYEDNDLIGGGFIL